MSKKLPSAVNSAKSLGHIMEVKQQGIIGDVGQAAAERASGKRVLYIGAGDEQGRLSKAAALTASVASEWHAIELDPVVAKTNPQLDIRLVDLNKGLPKDLPPIDVIIMTEVLEHLESPVRTLRQLASTFPGTLLFGSVPNALSFGRIISAVLSHKMYAAHDGNHSLLFNSRTLANTLHQAGLANFRIVPYDQHALIRPLLWCRPEFARGYAFEGALPSSPPSAGADPGSTSPYSRV